MRLIDLATYLVYLATYVVICPILVGIYFFAYQSKALKILCIGLLVVLFFDVVLLFFNAKNTFLYIFSAVDAIMMAAVFSAAIAKARTRKLVLLTGSLLVLLIGIDAFWGSGLANNGYSNALEKVFILVITIYYLTQLFQDEDTVNLADQPMFWVSMGLLVYNLVGLFDVFSKPVLSYSQNLYLQFYMIWSGVAIFMYGCFAFAFWRSKRFLNL